MLGYFLASEADSGYHFQIITPTCPFSSFHAKGGCRRHAKITNIFDKMSKLSNIHTIFGIGMPSAFERVQTCLASVK